MLEIKQKCNCKIIHVSKTVDWMIENTQVRTFNNISFTGYQRKVNENHVLKIVDYLKKNDFYLPTSIICASDEKVTNETRLNIVDGQHRVEAFKKLKEIDYSKYLEVKDCELSVIILEKPSEALEVDTFITINKTSRKVDTSLAYVLKNKINKSSIDTGNTMQAKMEFLAVELAIKINREDNSIWKNKILLEGNPTKISYETISLNSFVKTTRILISYLDKYSTKKFIWNNDDELNDIITQIERIYLNMWNEIQLKWSYLFIDKNINNTVIQGNIGVSSLNKYIIMQLKSLEEKKYSLDELDNLFCKWIKNLNISENLWYKGDDFSHYSSEAGFNVVAKILLDSYESRF